MCIVAFRLNDIFTSLYSSVMPSFESELTEHIWSPLGIYMVCLLNIHEGEYELSTSISHHIYRTQIKLFSYMIKRVFLIKGIPHLCWYSNARHMLYTCNIIH